jgi:hypothetical protein
MQTKVVIHLISSKLIEYSKAHAGKTVYAVGIADELSMHHNEVYDQLAIMEKSGMIEITLDELVMQVTFPSQEPNLPEL